MKVYFSGYRCNCTILEKTPEAIPSRCSVHDSEIIYGFGGARQEVEVDAWQPLGLFEKSLEGATA